MDLLRFLVGAFAVLFCTGYPFLWLIVEGVFSAALGRWCWDSRRKFFVANAIAYPFIFAFLWELADWTFGVSEEGSAYFRSMVDASEEAIRDGAPPEENNVVLGMVFLGAMYGGVQLVYTAGIGFVYFLGSTLAHGRRGFRAFWKAPLCGLSLAIIGIAATYLFRTPIFNWLFR